MNTLPGPDNSAGKQQSPDLPSEQTLENREGGVIDLNTTANVTNKDITGAPEAVSLTPDQLKNALATSLSELRTANGALCKLVDEIAEISNRKVTEGAVDPEKAIAEKLWREIASGGISANGVSADYQWGIGAANIEGSLYISTPESQVSDHTVVRVRWRGGAAPQDIYTDRNTTYFAADADRYVQPHRIAADPLSVSLRSEHEDVIARRVAAEKEQVELDYQTQLELRQSVGGRLRATVDSLLGRDVAQPEKRQVSEGPENGVYGLDDPRFKIEQCQPIAETAARVARTISSGVDLIRARWKELQTAD